MSKGKSRSYLWLIVLGSLLYSGFILSFLPDANNSFGLTGGNSKLSQTLKAAACGYTATFTEADTTSIAEKFDLFIFSPEHGISDVNDAADAVKTKNPSIITYAYRLSHMMYTGAADWATVDANEDWFLHTSLGARITNTESGWYLMDPASAGWQQHLVTYVNANYFADSTYDGLFLDDVHDEYPDVWSLSGEVQAADKASWHTDVLALVEYVYANIESGKKVMVNTDESGTYDFAGAVDAVMYEGQFHSDTGFSSTVAALQQIDNILYVTETLGKPCFVLSSDGNAVADYDILKYCYSASLLAGDISKIYFGFNSWLSDDEGYHVLMDSSGIGATSGSYGADQGVYIREFTAGKVLFNPSASQFTYMLPGFYRTVDNTKVAEVVLSGYTSEIVMDMTVTRAGIWAMESEVTAALCADYVSNGMTEVRLMTAWWKTGNIIEYIPSDAQIKAAITAAHDAGMKIFAWVSSQIDSGFGYLDVSTSGNRETAITSLTDLLSTYDFDGIADDVEDWDWSDTTYLIAYWNDATTALHATGHEYLTASFMNWIEYMGQAEASTIDVDAFMPMMYGGYPNTEAMLKEYIDEALTWLTCPVVFILRAEVNIYFPYKAPDNLHLVDVLGWYDEQLVTSPTTYLGGFDIFWQLQMDATQWSDWKDWTTKDVPEPPVPPAPGVITSNLAVLLTMGY